MTPAASSRHPCHAACCHHTSVFASYRLNRAAWRVRREREESDWRGKGKKERRLRRFSIGCGCSGRAAHSSEHEQLCTPLTDDRWLTLTCSLLARPSARQRQSVVSRQAAAAAAAVAAVAADSHAAAEAITSPHFPSPPLTSPHLTSLAWSIDAAAPLSPLFSRSPLSLAWAIMSHPVAHMDDGDVSMQAASAQPPPLSLLTFGLPYGTHLSRITVSVLLTVNSKKQGGAKQMRSDSRAYTGERQLRESSQAADSPSVLLL